MKVIVYLLGFGLIAICTYLILFTRETIDRLNGLFSTYQLKYISAVPALFGLLFLISASATVKPWAMGIVGLLALMKAVLVFLNPRNIATQIIDRYFGKASDRMHRLSGVIGIILGTLILTWIL